MNWMELMEERQSRKLGEMVWSCNCHAPIYPRREQVFTRMYPTKVTEEGLCVNCGHYAYRIEKDVLEMDKQRTRGIKYRREA